MSSTNFLRPDLLDTRKLGTTTAAASGTLSVDDALSALQGSVVTQTTPTALAARSSVTADQAIAALQGPTVTQTTVTAVAAGATVGACLAAIKTALDGASQGAAAVYTPAAVDVGTALAALKSAIDVAGQGTGAAIGVQQQSIATLLNNIAAKVVTMRSAYNQDRVHAVLRHLQLTVDALTALKV